MELAASPVRSAPMTGMPPQQILPRDGKNFLALFGEQGFVRRHHVFSAGEDFFMKFRREGRSADQFHDNRHLGVIESLIQIVVQQSGGEFHRPCAGQIGIHHMCQWKRQTGFFVNQAGFFQQNLRYSGTDRAESDDRNLHILAAHAFLMLQTVLREPVVRIHLRTTLLKNRQGRQEG